MLNLHPRDHSAGFFLPVALSVGSKALVIISMVFALHGCGFITLTRISINEPITTEDVTFITPGQTTLVEVISKLGTPDELTGLEEGGVIAYHFRNVKYSRINFGWPLQFWLPVSPDLILSGGGLGTDVFQVAFNTDWVAQHYSFAKHTQTNRYNPWLFRVQ